MYHSHEGIEEHANDDDVDGGGEEQGEEEEEGRNNERTEARTIKNSKMKEKKLKNKTKLDETQE